MQDLDIQDVEKGPCYIGHMQFRVARTFLPIWSMWLPLHDTMSFARYIQACKNGDIGVCLNICKENFAFPQMLYESECHRR